jgi:hypothetical protein
MSKLFAIALAVGVLGGGCLSKESAGAPPATSTSTTLSGENGTVELDALPPDWQRGIGLNASVMGGSHSGGRWATLYPNGTLEKPSSCKAYRNADHHSRDSCTLRDPQYSWEANKPWLINAGWAGCPGGGFEGCPEGTYPPPYQQRVVAFDQNGTAVAWWDGRPSPDTQYITE